MLKTTQRRAASASVFSALICAGMISSQPLLAADMGKSNETIKLAINEWTGQNVTTHIAGSMLTELGYTVEYVTAGNFPQHAALADGTIHATMEVWTNNVGDIYPQMKEAGKIVDIGPLGLETNEGWVYPIHMEQLCPGLPDWTALANCKDVLATADTFPQGRILSYPADWGTRSADIIKGLGLDYKAIPAGSEGALIAELKSAAAAKSPLVMMFWAPHWAFAEVEVNWVNLPEYADECMTDPAWGPNPSEVNDCGVDKPKTVKVAWSGFEETWPAAWTLLQSFSMSAADQELMMKAIDNDGKDLETIVAAWMAENQSTWKPWVEQAKGN